MDVALEKRQVKRAYKIYAPAYDLVFDWIFNPGRQAAIRLPRRPPGRQRCSRSGSAPASTCPSTRHTAG